MILKVMLGHFYQCQMNSNNLSTSIDNVISSYNIDNDQNEVLVQPMLKDVKISGVAFSHDPTTCSPYRIINYSKGSDTSLVTSK